MLKQSLVINKIRESNFPYFFVICLLKLRKMDKKKLKKYLIDENSDVYAVSLVDAPAIESNFIFLKSQKPIFLESDEKRMVYGCALRPDFPIYRIYDDEEFYVEFSKKTVEKLSQKFLKNGFQNNWTIDHQDAVSGVYVTESWIKTDMEKDKSIALGLDKDLPIGSWFVGCKVENDDVWQSVKNGDFKGFSIEAFVEMEEFNKIKNSDKYMIQNTLDEDSFLDKIKNIINDALGRPNVVEEPIETVNNDSPIVSIEDAVNNAIGEKIDEMVVEKVDEIVNDEQVVEQNNVEETIKVDEPIVEEPKPEEIVDEVVETVEENAENKEEVKEDLQEIINGLNAQIASMQAELEQLRNENKKLGGMPSANPVNVRSAQKTTWETIEALRNGTYFK